MKFPSSPRFYLLVAGLLLALTISNDSLWLDEGDTAKYASQPDFTSWIHFLWADRQADCQMPLAMLGSWAAGKVIGTQEWQLRALNLLWGALALIALSRVGRRLQMPWLPLLLAIQPYFWFYLNEARPFALQLAGGAWLLAALVEFLGARAAGTGWAWQLSVSAFLLFCATLLAPLSVAMTVLAGGFIAWHQGWRPERRAMQILLGGLLASIPVAIYYVTTLLHGARGAQVWPVDLKFIAYVIYELTGMGGIGLSDVEIRALARSPHLVNDLINCLPKLLWPAVLGGLLAVAGFIGLRRSSPTVRRDMVTGILFVFIATAGVFVVGSLVIKKAFWARHYAPIFPFYVTLLGFAFVGIWSNSRRWMRALPFAICLLLAWSSLNFRFAPALRKEDYRAAAAYVRPLIAQGHTVWWMAGGYPANYYGLDTAYFEPSPGMVFVAFRSREDVRQLALPDVIVLNKPDIHDPGGVVQRLMEENHYGSARRFQGFTIWTNPAATFISDQVSPDKSPDAVGR